MVTGCQDCSLKKYEASKQQFLAKHRTVQVQHQTKLAAFNFCLFLKLKLHLKSKRFEDMKAFERNAMV